LSWEGLRGDGLMDAWKNTSHLLDAIVPTTRMLDLNRWAKCNMMELGYRGRDG